MDRRLFLGGMMVGAAGLLSACGGSDGSGSGGGGGKLTKAKLAEVFEDYVGTYDVYPNHWNDGNYTGKGAIGDDFDPCEKYVVELLADGSVVIHGNGGETYTFGPDDLIEDKSEDVGYEIYVNFENSDGIGMKWQASSPDGPDGRDVEKDDGFFIMMGQGEYGWANPDNGVGLYSEDMMSDGVCESLPT